MIKSIFNTACIQEKMTLVDSIFNGVDVGPMPQQVARDVQVLEPHLHPIKVGLSYPQGQARLLHDLASIELQALELCLRTYVEYPNTPSWFREQLQDVALSEKKHLQLCLKGLEDLQCPWGTFPVHLGLWQAVSAEDTLLDRLLIVHRYLEGSGLDAGDTLLRRLAGIPGAGIPQKILQVIHDEEHDHVLFGSRSYIHFCKDSGLDPDEDFSLRLRRLRKILPKRIEKISIPCREKAGFSAREISALEDLRREFLKPLSAISK